jgi:cytochrome P450
LTAREGLKARKRLADGFENYLRSDNQRFASSAVKSTLEIVAKNNLSLEDSARLEIFNTSVATVNTVPTAVWMLLNILANDDLLLALRGELASAMKITPTSTGRDIHLDISNITETCPLLHATYQESLRLGSIPTCNRSVLEDTVLTDPDTGRRIALKKGHRVVIPTFMLHFRDSFWSGNAREFDPWRFMNTTEKDSKEKKLRNTAFVPFGGGIHLCPGRHLAQAEILAVAGLMIAALDFQLSDGGKITVPMEASESGSKKPAVPIIVGIRKRAGWEDATWSVQS